MNQLNDLSLEGAFAEDMLPEELQQMILLQKEKKFQQVEAIGNAIAKKRDEAVEGRAASGIDEEWAEDEDAYQGFDSANRNEAKIYKSADSSGSLQSIPRQSGTRSTVFLNITRPYVDAAAARVADMLMPTDDRNWSLKPTPIPQIDEVMQNLAKNPEAMAQAKGDPRFQQMQQIMQEANKRAEAAQTQIDDWHVECGYHGEIRKALENCARLGTGIMKGPTPAKRKSKKTENGAMVMSIEICPESKSINPDRLFPDPACGESIHNGSYVFELDDLSTRQLRDLKGLSGYIAENIDKVIEEGPSKINKGTANKTRDEDKFEVWYYYGFLDRDDLESMDVELDSVSTSKMEGIPAIVTLVNDTPIRASLNPLDSGDFPYDVMPWQRRAGHWAGVGVSRQIRTPQRMLNAATRNLMDNAGLSAGPQVVVWRNKIKPADGKWELSPRKLWFANEDADIRTVTDAIGSINIQSLQAELMNIIQFAMKMAEDVTGLPQLLQGQQGKAPETVGGMQMLQNNATAVLRRIARSFDDHITRPHITRYYEWILTYSEDESLKGDFTIDVRGSSVLVERDIQNQAVLQMGQMVMNPAFGIDPEKWIQEAFKVQRLDPNRFLLDPEKKAEMAQRQAPPPPQVAVAQIRAQSAEKIAQMNNQTQQVRIKTDTDRDAIYVQAEMRRDQANAIARMEELRLKKEIAALEAQIKKGISVDDAKVRLSETAMKLRTQKELAFMNARQVANPAVEPVGRAENGKAYFQ